MWAHPLSTYRVDRCCESCALKRAKTDRAVDEIRERIQFTRELLDKIQGGSKGLRRSGSDGEKSSDGEAVIVDTDTEDDYDVEEAENMDLIHPDEAIQVSKANFRAMVEFARGYASVLGDDSD